MAFTQSTFQPWGGQAKRAGSGFAAGVAAGVSTPRAPQIWSYLTEDAATVVDGAGYFNAVRPLLEIGDVIYRVTVNASGVVQSAGWHVVMTKSATSVDVSDTTALTVTNAD